MANAEERVLELEREVQSLRLELQAQKRSAEKLKQELERQRGSENARLATAQLEKLFGDAAAPISQLTTQYHLLKVEERPVQTGDVLAIATRLIRTLEDYGLRLEGSVGQTVAFDPNQHELLSVDESLAIGDSAVIRLVGIAYQGKLLRKAGVIAGV